MAKPSIRLRSARPSDAERISAIWQSSIRTLCLPDYDDCREEMEAFAASKTPALVRTLIEAEEWFIVAETNNCLAGFFCVSFSIGSFALYVDPEFSGRGIGSRLFRCCERLALEDDLCSFSFLSTRNARSFYLTCGCKDAGAIVNDPIPAYPMVRRLTELQKVPMKNF